jgi:hypothetical protein
VPSIPNGIHETPGRPDLLAYILAKFRIVEVTSPGGERLQTGGVRGVLEKRLGGRRSVLGWSHQVTNDPRLLDRMLTGERKQLRTREDRGASVQNGAT